MEGANLSASWTPPRFFRLKRMMLAIAGALANVNIWTGAPALALWVGAQTHEWAGGRAPGTGVSMQSILIVLVVLGGAGVRTDSGRDEDRAMPTTSSPAAGRHVADRRG